MEDSPFILSEEGGRRGPFGEWDHPGDAFLPLLFVLMIDPLIKIMKRRVGDQAEIIYYMDDLKASMNSIETAKKVHATVKKYAEAVGMVIDSKKSAIQLNVEAPLPDSLQDIPRLDETTYKYLGFEMRKGQVERNEMMETREERIREKLEDPLNGVEMFEAGNWVQYINQNIMSLVRFYSGPIKFTLRWLDPWCPKPKIRPPFSLHHAYVTVFTQFTDVTNFQASFSTRPSDDNDCLFRTFSVTARVFDKRKHHHKRTPTTFTVSQTVMSTSQQGSRHDVLWTN